MYKSQLRKLAIRRAQGGLNLEEYGRRRRILIEEIINGNLAIEREVPTQRPNHALNTDNQTAPFELEQHTVESPRSIPLHYYFAAGASVCVLVLIWALWPMADKPAPAPVPPAPAVQKISIARTLVESFLALRDYSEASVSEFERGWQQLESQDREQARNELWFRSLSRSIRDEVKTQRALAQLAESEDSKARIDRLYQLAQTLDISNQLPSRGQTPAPSATSQSEQSEASDTSQQALPTSEGLAGDTSEQTSEQTDQSGESTVSDTATAASDDATPTAREWLTMQPLEAYSLQIFAVNKLARVEELIARHPDHAFQILAKDGSEPRYRVYLGSYTDKQQASDAFDRLADDVKKAAGSALVKSFAEIRLQLSLETPAGNEAQPGTDSAVAQYTLQLFASDNHDNAQALTRQFNALGLELHELSDNPAAYRVLYGRFENADLALKAGDGLPPELLKRIGKPLVKSLTELSLTQ